MNHEDTLLEELRALSSRGPFRVRRGFSEAAARLAIQRMAGVGSSAGETQINTLIHNTIEEYTDQQRRAVGGIGTTIALWFAWAFIKWAILYLYRRNQQKAQPA